MRKLSMLLCFIILMQDISLAFVTRDITVKTEKVIPFSFTSDNMFLEEDLSIKGLKDVKIKNMYVDNGDISTKISDNYIELEFDNGERFNNYRTIRKTDSIEFDEVKLDNEEDKKITVIPGKSVKSIQDVSGDFESATILSNGDIEIKVKSSAKGITGLDENTVVKDTFTAKIDDKNISRQVLSDKIILPYEVQGTIKAKSGDTSAVQKIYVDKNEVQILFNNGNPIANETTIKSGYTYFWIDRSENGTFKKYNPNSVYSTDINKITGLGEYIDESEFDEIGVEVSNSNWADYCGIEKDGIRYIYVYDKSKGIPKSFSGNVILKDYITFDGQELNTETFTAKFSNAGVSYIPEGKLYSMGELVKNTSGWGETSPNKSYESTKTFFNSLTGKLETYVKHFKFFYGPKEKKTFGGYYTYPYACTFEYQHYKPTTYYSGEVIYEYESQEKINGYSYNGWVKIEYTEEKTVSDYPPTPPFNVKYNPSNGNITWCNGSDDYTDTLELKYEVQVYDGEWKTIENRCFGELQTNYIINYSEPDVRIRTVDDTMQVSDWSYASNSEIKLKGEVKPYIVEAGDNISIFANTKSLSKIENVIAKNDELQMYTELEKISESTPNFYEMSYDVEADFPDEGDDVLVVSNGRDATGNRNKMISARFVVGKEYNNGNVNFKIPTNKNISKNGSLIFSNVNYDNIPIDMFYYNSKYWYTSFDNTIYIKNKVTGKEEVFIKVVSDTKSQTVNRKSVIIPTHYISINTFEYDTAGTVKYKEIEVDKSQINRPLCITWNTDKNNITAFSIYLGNELIHTYTAKWGNINTHVDNFSSIYMYKRMKKYALATYGFINPSSTTKANWNKIVISLANNRDLRDFPWLGYRVRKNEYIKEQYVEEYNANPNVRNNYRLLISDDSMSKEAIKRYMDILKTTNISMTKDQNTVFGDDAMEYTSTFQGINIKVPDTAKAKEYEIDLIAKDIDGRETMIKLTLIVTQKEKEIEDIEEKVQENIEIDKSYKVLGNYLGRFFYRNDKGYLEELKKTDKSENGFICAGETLGLYLIANGTDYIEVDFKGDSSIKTLDTLTKKFLIDTPSEKGKNTSNVKYQYLNFPKRIYPSEEDSDGNKIYKWFYTIPYKTISNLESWSTLKNSTLENIDISKLFDKRDSSYELVIYINGNMEDSIHLHFDVFERWDTILNRNVTKYVTNSDTRWEMRINK